MITNLYSTLHLPSASNHLLVNSPSTLELSADMGRHVLPPAYEVAELRRGGGLARGHPGQVARHADHTVWAGGAALPVTLKLAADFVSYTPVIHPNLPQLPSEAPCKRLL